VCVRELEGISNMEVIHLEVFTFSLRFMYRAVLLLHSDTFRGIVTDLMLREQCLLN
jgi:hypothetical protein